MSKRIRRQIGKQAGGQAGIHSLLIILLGPSSWRLVQAGFPSISCLGLSASLHAEWQIQSLWNVGRLQADTMLPRFRVLNCSEAMSLAVVMCSNQTPCIIRCSIVVSISARHAEDLGSIPGGGVVALRACLGEVD